MKSIVALSDSGLHRRIFYFCASFFLNCFLCFLFVCDFFFRIVTFILWLYSSSSNILLDFFQSCPLIIHWNLIVKLSLCFLYWYFVCLIFCVEIYDCFVFIIIISFLLLLLSLILILILNRTYASSFCLLYFWHDLFGILIFCIFLDFVVALFIVMLRLRRTLFIIPSYY